MIRRYLLDTGIAQDYQENRLGVRSRFLEKQRCGHRIGICIPVLGELWSGVEGSIHRAKNVRRLAHALSQLIVWPYTSEAAAEYGRIFMELRRLGRVIQQIDIQIGAIVRTLPNCILVSKDSDMSSIPGITIENWAA